MTYLIAVLIGLIIGGAIGAGWREILALKRVTEKKPVELPKREGVVAAAYMPANETKQSPIVVRPKTPQQMEWMAMTRLDKEVLGRHGYN